MQEITDVTPKMDSNMADDYYDVVDIKNMSNLSSSLDGGSSKPIFETNTLATVVDVSIKRNKQAATTKSGNDTYFPLIVTITTQTDDGQISYDNYGGLRETSEGGLWCGDDSALGQLISLCKEEKKLSTFEDFFSYISEGLRVKIQTKTNTYKGQEYKKNIITQIVQCDKNTRLISFSYEILFL